uniref:Uncharacterized protein LOC113794182 n=1 Tax=Dermatophagoides pteronyssinus TaxID=6956 RepID=A0A6P6Y4X8_DERPT|nr:uncharacterized protein LOC113794182 [Dermatophagoides pteronyssinus]
MIAGHLFLRFMLRLYLYLKHNPERFYERQNFLKDENFGVCLGDIRFEKHLPDDPPRMIHFLSLFKHLDSLKIEWNIKGMSICHGICYQCGFIIFDYGMQRLGAGLYISESRLKHSCSTSAKTLFNGTQLVLRATRPIEIGEQITINDIYFSNLPSSLESTLLGKIFRTYNFFSYECRKCVSENEDYFLKKFKILGQSRKLVDAISDCVSNNLNEIYRVCKICLSTMSEICSECHLGLILHKINILEIYANIHDDVKELSVAELAKIVEITLPSVYNEIFENTYFNREEKASFTIVKALANVEFNVKKN